MAIFSHASKSVSIPMDFINKYMPQANATYVKVYLYGLLKCYENEDVSNAAIADALDILETDVNKAWRYWKRVGLVHSEGKGTLVFDNIPVSDEKQKADSSAEEKTEEVKVAQPKVKEELKIEKKELPKTMEISSKMKETVSMAEQLLKRTLSRREVTSIYNFTEWYSMSQEMVLVLLEYCITIDKMNFSYVEKVAQGWNERGITTLEAATAELNRVLKEVRMRNKCKKIFGLDREFTGTEAGYIARWVSEYSMNEPMIKAAYERTIANTGNLTMPYMNSILKSWFDKGIKNASQIAEKESKAAKGKNQGTYQLDDMAAIERRIRLEKQKK